MTNEVREGAERYADLTKEAETCDLSGLDVIFGLDNGVERVLDGEGDGDPSATEEPASKDAAPRQSVSPRLIAKAQEQSGIDITRLLSLLATAPESVSKVVPESADNLREIFKDDAANRSYGEASLDELVVRFTPRMPPEAVERFKQLVRMAQERPPQNREDFVEKVGLLCDKNDLRFKIEGEAKPARLILSAKNSFQFKAGGTNRGFKRSFEVISVPSDYGRRGTPSPTKQ